MKKTEKQSMAEHMFGNNIQSINEFLVDAFKDNMPKIKPLTVEEENRLFKLMKKDK